MSRMSEAVGRLMADYDGPDGDWSEFYGAMAEVAFQWQFGKLSQDVITEIRDRRVDSALHELFEECANLYLYSDRP